MAAPTAHDAAMRHAAKREGYDGLEWCGVGKRCPRAEFAYSEWLCAGCDWTVYCWMLASRPFEHRTCRLPAIFC